MAGDVIIAGEETYETLAIARGGGNTQSAGTEAPHQRGAEPCTNSENERCRLRHRFLLFL